MLFLDSTGGATCTQIGQQQRCRFEVCVADPLATSTLGRSFAGLGGCKCGLHVLLLFVLQGLTIFNPMTNIPFHTWWMQTLRWLLCKTERPFGLVRQLLGRSAGLFRRYAAAGVALVVAALDFLAHFLVSLTGIDLLKRFQEVQSVFYEAF